MSTVPVALSPQRAYHTHTQPTQPTELMRGTARASEPSARAGPASRAIHICDNAPARLERDEQRHLQASEGVFPSHQHPYDE